MASPLEGSIRRAIGKAMSPIFYAATLSRTVVGEPNPETPWIPGVTTTTEYPCRGFVDTYSDFYIAASLILAGDRKVTILADSLAVTPAPGDSLHIRGASYVVVNVASDPATATWTLQVRA